MANPVMDEIERALLRRAAFRDLMHRTAGTTAEVLRSDPERNLCYIRYSASPLGSVERWAPVTHREGISGAFPAQGDTVWVSFAGGDPSMPVVVASASKRHDYRTSSTSLPGLAGA